MTPTRIATAVAALAAVAVVAGCSSSSSETTSSSTAPTGSTMVPSSPTGMQPGPTAQPRPCRDGRICTPDQVMVAALDEVFTYRGADTDPAQAAADRAADLLTPTYRASAAGSFSMLAPVTGNQWAQWKATGSTVVASARVLSDEHPPDTATSAARVARISQTVTPGGQKLDPLTVWVVAKAGGPAGWQLDTITTQQ
ncbi:hypothetical protein [uncultured Williamsia sp.]|uniref:hypothetical protein n=1 Tax=uncultured Williamsia sp. TaxID=259311 RepID=UPI0026161F19|nr:hypothetical protein [uncultured Williamsia sp.]